MFQFPRLPSHRLCIHLWILKHYLKCVPAFGNLRIIGYLLLPAAYRSLSRPSSAPSAKASALCSFSLDLLLVFSLFCFVALSRCGTHIPKYAPFLAPSAPCIKAKILRNLHCRFLFKTNIFQIPTLALCVGFLYYCFTRSENFLVFSVNLRNCILTLHFSWISEPTKFWKNTLVIYLDFVFVVNLLIHNLILYSVFKVHLASHLLWLVVENKGFEPLTPCVQGRCSPSWAMAPIL